MRAPYRDPEAVPALTSWTRPLKTRRCGIVGLGSTCRAPESGHALIRGEATDRSILWIRPIGGRVLLDEWPASNRWATSERAPPFGG